MSSPILSLKNSFAGGEVSPQLYGRVDLTKYASWCRKLKNMLVNVDGSASNRPGTYYMGAAKYANRKCRVRKFVFSTEQAYQLEIGHEYIRFFTVTTASAIAGQIVKTIADTSAWLTGTTYYVGNYVKEAGVIYYCIKNHIAGTFATDLAFPKWVAQSIYEIPTLYQEEDLELLKFTQSADVLFIAHPDYTPQELSRLGAKNWTLTNYPFTGGPFQLPNTDPSILLDADATTGLGINVGAWAKDWITGFAYQVGMWVDDSGTTYQCLVKHTSTVFATDLSYAYWVAKSLVVFQPTHAPSVDGSSGALFQLRHYVQGVKVTQSAAGSSAGIKCGGTWRVISHGTWTSNFSVEKSTDNGATWTNLRTFTSVSDNNVSTFGTEDMANNAEPFLVRITVGVVSAGSITVDLTTDAFYQTGIVQVTAYIDGTSVTADVMRTIADTTATEDWTEGSWSDYRGWPAVVEFSPQDRLIMANTYLEPQTFWMTQSGNYYDYSRSSPLIDSDGITVNLPSREVNGINNLVPLTALLALTSSSEWSIGDPGTAFTPTSAEQRINGYEGSAFTDTVVIGNRALFAQTMGAAIRDLGYELATYSFTGSDITVMANHLFFNYVIKELDYQKYPTRVVWVTRSDGRLLSCTYLREQEVLAWSWHETNDGTDLFESCAVAPSDGLDETWFVVKRGNARYIERMVKRLGSYDIDDQFFVDSGITYSGAPATVISGLGHLEGRTVAVLADGNVKAQRAVVGGSITLDVEASVVHVGLPYTSDIETMNVEIPMKDGTAQGRKMKISQIVLGVWNSAGGWIGTTFDDLHELRDNFVDYYGTPAALYTGELKDTLGGGMNEGARICIRQIDPLPITIRYISGAVTPGGMTGV